MSNNKKELYKLIEAKKVFIEAKKEFEANTGQLICGEPKYIHLFEGVNFLLELELPLKSSESDMINYDSQLSTVINDVAVFTLVADEVELNE